MLLKKKVKGGILLYALLMSAVFALVLQFYLGRVVAMERQQSAQLLSTKAYLMAQMTKQVADKLEGKVSFEQGQATYEAKGGVMTVNVLLKNGQSFSYDFNVKSDEGLSEKKVEETAKQEETDSSQAPKLPSSTQNDMLGSTN